ncbi:MAG: type I restriction enzyme HsdR N-terminal domain-containing protein [Muribaculaceae bacterium]|nr:type I restriction enzyme HsdR N-terminal domain-containing protein [Muribaculaceae bacterium]
MPLNLPQYKFNIRHTSSGDKIYDRLRNKYVALTPEEWVRQHFTSYLIEHKGYPASLMANEVPLTLNGTSRRSDTVVFNRNGKPLVIIEYKACSVDISQKTFDQIVRYNMVLHAQYLIVSNGMNHYCCHIDYDSHSYSFLPEIPDYNTLTEK